MVYKQFVCEICGDQDFEGHLPFAEHFNSTKHAMELRKLGIQYDKKNFLNVTSVAKAKMINSRIIAKKAKKLELIGKWKRVTKGALKRQMKMNADSGEGNRGTGSQVLKFNDSDSDEDGISELRSPASVRKRHAVVKKARIRSKGRMKKTIFARR